MYVNAVDLAFWPNKALIGNWTQEDIKDRQEDPYHKNLVAGGVDYQDAMRILLSNLRGMGVVMGKDLISDLMSRSEAKDKEERLPDGPVYVGLVTGTTH